MISTRQKEVSDANPESPPRTHPETNIGGLRSTIWTVFTQEQNELFVQQVVQYSQYLESKYFHYHVLVLNDSSTEDDTNKAYS